MNELYELIRSDNTLYANRTLARAIGLNEAIIFSALLSKEHYYRSEGQLDEEGMFYSTADDLEESTTLTQRQQERAIKRLENLGLIITKVKSMPARKHFRINQDTETLRSLLKNKDEPKADEIKKPVSESINLGENDSTKSGNKFQQNVETGIDEMSKHDSAKCENQFQQNVEQNLSNKTYIKKIYKHKHNERSYPQTYPQAHERIIKAWNSLGLSKIRFIEGDGETMLNALIEQYGEDQVVKAVESIKESDLLRGRRPSGFIIQFGWFLKPDNFVNVLERKYIDDPKTPVPTRPPDNIVSDSQFDINDFFAKAVEVGMKPNGAKNNYSEGSGSNDIDTRQFI